MLFGGEGNMVMLEIVRRLEACGRRLQLIAICGHNQKLTNGCARLKPASRCWWKDSPGRCRTTCSSADFFIGKPGPGSISEALEMRLPVIVESQRLDAAAGALQRRVGHGERRRAWC